MTSRVVSCLEIEIGKASALWHLAVENHAHSVALFVMCHNSVRIYQTLKVTSAMAAKVTELLCEIGDIVDKLEAWDARK